MNPLRNCWHAVPTFTWVYKYKLLTTYSFLSPAGLTLPFAPRHPKKDKRQKPTDLTRTSNEPNKNLNGGRHEPFTVRYPQFQTNALIFVRIRENFIVVASTRQKKKQAMASIPPFGDCCTLRRRSPIELCDEIEGGEQQFTIVLPRYLTLTAEDISVKSITTGQHLRVEGVEFEFNNASAPIPRPTPKPK
eukprot:scaffold157425_cov24-Cyclotella_meneghiniana.AAC.1